MTSGRRWTSLALGNLKYSFLPSRIQVVEQDPDVGHITGDGVHVVYAVPFGDSRAGIYAIAHEIAVGFPVGNASGYHVHPNNLV